MTKPGRIGPFDPPQTAPLINDNTQKPPHYTLQSMLSPFPTNKSLPGSPSEMANLRPGSPSLDLTGCDVSNHERIPSDTSVKQITWQSDDFEDSDATTRDQGSQPGDLDPTEEVSRILQDLDAVPEPEKIGRLRSLTSECLYRFKPEGDLLGIDAAISVLEKAILTISHDHNLKPILLNQLGDVYRCRFENQEESKDIDMAINSKKQAVSLVHDNILLSRDWLNELAMFYLDRFHSEQDFSDINMAIEHMSRAASPVNKDPSGKTKRLNNLANLHHVRFQHLGDLADIYTAIELLHLVAKHASDADSDTVGPLDSEVDGKLEIAVSSLTGGITQHIQTEPETCTSLATRPHLGMKIKP